MSELDCKDTESRLEDFVDGRLGSEEERRVRHHLAACEPCRTSERGLRRLLTRVAELPREIEPSRDLWPGVASRLEARRPQDRNETGSRSEAGTGRLLAGPWTRWTPRQWAWQAAAAFVFMVLGALVAELGDSPPGTGGLPSADPEPGAVALASHRSLGFEDVETEYLRAKEALWLMVYGRSEELSPVEVEIVRRNLLIIDDAIRDLREALAEDPGNRRLESSLLAQHRRSIGLLQRLTRPSPGAAS